jgi:hypothetical protein
VALVRNDVLRSVLPLVVTAYFIPSSPIPFTLMVVALRSSEPLILTRATRRNNPEGGILQSHSRESFTSYSEGLIQAISGRIF